MVRQMLRMPVSLYHFGVKKSERVAWKSVAMMMAAKEERE